MNILRILCIMALLSEIRGSPRRNCTEKTLDFNLYKLGDKLIQLHYKYTQIMTFPNNTVVKTVNLFLYDCQNVEDIEAKTFDLEEIFSKADRMRLMVENVVLPPFPESAKVTEALLRDVAPRYVWGSCTFLHTLHIQTTDLTRVPSDWLSNCTQLRKMVLETMTVSQVRSALISAPAIEELILSSLEGLYDIISQPLFPANRQKQIRILKLSASAYYNAIPDNITWNTISGALIWQISLLTNLVELDIQNFVTFDFCALSSYPAVTLSQVKYLYISNTCTSHVCFKSFRVLPKLTYVLLINNNLLQNLQFSELYSSNAPRLRVTLEDSPIVSLEFTRDDYLALSNGSYGGSKGHVSLATECTIDCECGQSLWLTRALLDGLITDLEVNCNDGSSFYSQDCKMLECDRIYCEGPCICCSDINDTISVDCRGIDLHELPSEVLFLENVTAVLAPNLTHLSSLPKYLPDSLRLLDLSGNDVLLKSTKEELAILFKESSRRVRLAGNGIVCSCDYKPVLEMLQDHRNQIEDYEKLICVDSGKKLGDVDILSLCAKQDQETAILAAISAALILAVITLTVGIILYYRKEVQIFFFARGWCLCLIKEDELDAERRYDVFLSFCHEESEFVLQNIFPILDEEYLVCMHYRDWLPGEMIITQINNSIAQSRRTVAIMSKKFVKSLWGLMEFRTAYSSGISEGRVRLVVVIVDDLLEDEDLIGEIRSYVRLNTYVKWGDPWFWDKLRYALPHNPRPRTVLSGAPASNDQRVQNIEMVEYPNQS